VLQAITMGAVGVTALASNAAVFALLWAYRSGDSNMRSVWICSRQRCARQSCRALAALGVFGAGTGWSDVIVAAIMAALALQGAWAVMLHAFSELERTAVRTRDGGDASKPSAHIG
jgi:Co/Zn/Cd efflux system component